MSRLYRPRVLGALLVFIACAALHAAHADARAQARTGALPLIVFMTDFGTVDDAVAICKGVMLSITPDARIVDITHQVTPYSIADGARLLARTALYYPPGTVFVTVIDPGVGTARRSVVVKTRRGQYFVLPDNGLVTSVADRDGVEAVREVGNRQWLLAGSASSTFHGRDVYSPVGAHLARGDDWTLVGPIVTALTRLDAPLATVDQRGIEGSVVALDGPFGNLVTNITEAEFRALGYRLADPVRVVVEAAELVVPFVATFGDVRPGMPLLFIDSRGLVSLAINRGNFSESYSVHPPARLRIYRQ